MQLSEALRRFRKEYGVTQKQAAQAGGVNERNYQGYEYDKVIPTVTVIMNLASKYDVSTDYLLGLSDNPNRM